MGLGGSPDRKSRFEDAKEEQEFRKSRNRGKTSQTWHSLQRDVVHRLEGAMHSSRNAAPYVPKRARKMLGCALMKIREVPHSDQNSLFDVVLCPV